MEQLITQRVVKAIKEKVFPGCVIGVVKKNGKRTILSFGKFTYEKGSNDVKENAIYDVASVTKAIPTSSLLLSLIDQKKIGLEDRIVDSLPEFGNFDNKRDVLVKHLLTYTLDLVVPSMASLKDNSPDEIVKIIMEAPLRNSPGSKFLYTNSTTMFMGLLIEKVSGVGLTELADEYFFSPLKMYHTTFHPEKFDVKNIAPTEIDEWKNKVIQGEVHDESTYVLQQKHYLGLSGLFSTVPDLLTFLEMLLNNGMKDGKQYFSSEIIEQMHTNQVADISNTAGLGWELNQPHFMGTHSTKQTFGKTGFTGCVVLCDIVKEVGIVLLSNRTYPKRPQNSELINEVRKDIADIVFCSL